MSLLRILESALGTSAALVVVLGGRQLLAFLSYRALRAKFNLRGRLK